MIDPRARITEGLNQERIKTEARRSAKPTVFFIAGLIAAFAICGYLLSHISQTFGSKTYEVRFEVGTAFGIFEGFDPVRFRGVPAGTITKVERDGARIVLVAKIKKRYGPVYKNARAAVRPITPLNDIYLDIVDPGTAAAGKADRDTPLPQSQTTTSVTVPDVLDGLRADQRLGLQRVLDQLGNGLEDGGAQLQRAFVAAAPFVRRAGDLTRQIAVRERATKQLVTNTAILTRELGRRDRELRRLVTAGTATVTTLQAGSRDLDQTLAELGPTVSELRTTLASLRTSVDDIDKGVTSLYPVADGLPTSLRAVRELNADLRPAIRKLDPTVRVLTPFIEQVLANSDQGGPASKALLPLVPTVDRLTQRLVDCEKGVIGFFQWNASLTKFGDATAPIPRGGLAIGAPDIGARNAPKRQPEKACTPGFPPRAIPTDDDKH